MSSPLEPSSAVSCRGLRLAALVVLSALVAACGASRSTPPAVAPPIEGSARPATPLETALTLLGTPYRDGGSTPRGFDCSGFIQYVFGAHGLRLPRTTVLQFKQSSPVEARDARAGDLVFFRTTSRGPSHVGIVIDRDRFVHAPAQRGVVRIEPLALPYWKRRTIGFRRVGTMPQSPR